MAFRLEKEKAKAKAKAKAFSKQEAAPYPGYWKDFQQVSGHSNGRKALLRTPEYREPELA